LKALNYKTSVNRPAVWRMSAGGLRRRADVRAIILPIILVIFALLTLLAVSFSFSTRAQLSAVRSETLLAQARAAAASGVESAALLLTQEYENIPKWYDNPELFKEVVLHGTYEEGRQRQDVSSISAWRYSLVAPDYTDQEKFRYGLTDEASKVNINTASRDMLLRLPGMTEELADALIQWRSAASTESAPSTQSAAIQPEGASGLELEPPVENADDTYYATRDAPYRAKHGPFDTVEELLLVKGFTAEILFGEDMNRNGILDANENDGSRSLPPDNGDGILNPGLYPYITVYSREPDVTDSNPYQPRININTWPEDRLRTALQPILRGPVVDFILQARKAKVDFGPTPANLYGLKYKTKTTAGRAARSSRRSGRGRRGGRRRARRRRAREQVHTSPVTAEDLPAIMDYLTTGYKQSSDGYVYGRININTAPREVLATIGKLTETEIDGIISVRQRLDEASRKTTAWLVAQNVLTAEKYKQVAYLFTARSFQFTIESLGYADREAVTARLQAVLEIRMPRVQYLYWRDLTSLGPAYHIESLSDEDDDTLFQ